MPETQPPPGPEFHLRILVIDDDERSLLVMRKYLAAAGHEAETFKDAEAGLARLACASFDMVMTDRAMTAEPGRDVFVFGRSTTGTRRCKV